jgi:hypothetical protein
MHTVKEKVLLYAPVTTEFTRLKLNSSKFPAFLYADASKYDPKKPHRGLLKGPLLVRVSDVANTCVSF